MLKYLEEHLALSKQGAKDLVKASLACAATDIGLMFPMGIIYLLLGELLPEFDGTVNHMPSMGKYLGLIALAVAVLVIVEYVQYNATFVASYTESAKSRISLSEKLRKLPLSFFGQRDLSDLTTTIMSDSAGLETAFSHFIPELIGAFLSTVLIGIGLIYMNAKLALAALWVVPVAFVMTLASKRKIDRGGKRSKQLKLAVADGIQECLETVREIKANNQEEDYLKGLDKKLEAEEKCSFITELTTGICVTSSQLILRFGIASVVLLGSSMLIDGEVSLLIFLMFLIAVSRIYEPLSGNLSNLAAVFDTLLKVDRMKEIKDHSVQTGAEQAHFNNYNIKFDHVGFAYENGETVLKDISFTAKQGEVTALIGPSGGGKSTAAKLSARFWDVSKGKITLGGKDISTIEPEKLLENYAIVFQDVTLFNNTIMENIRLGKRGASDEEVYAAARAARCEEFIERLPDKYQTIIGENGAILSGGERQRLSIARALLKNAPVILLDEATASLDVENESKIQEALSNLVENKTVIIIAHRMRTVANADHIVVLDGGYVAEQGRPGELMRKNGMYAKMLRLQQLSNNWELGKRSNEKLHQL